MDGLTSSEPFSQRSDNANPNTPQIIKLQTNNLFDLHDESVKIANSLMKMAGAEAERITDGAVFWTFTNTGEHATVEDAIERIGAHPAVQKLVHEYDDITKRMVALERYIARLSSEN